MVLMRVRNHQLLLPVARVVGFCAAVGLCATAVPAATAANIPSPQKITGIIGTVIVEQPRQNAITNIANIADNTETANNPAGSYASETVKILRTGNKVVLLADGSLPTTKDGTTVSVTVVPDAEGAQRVVSASTISAPATADAPATHHVYVALALPRGVTADASLSDASARAMVGRVSRYWSDQSGAQITFGTSQVLAYRSAYTCASTSTLWSEALAKMPQASGPGRHLVVVAPSSAQDLGCPYGLGTVGGVNASGNLVFVSGLNQSLLAHELGHNLGLYHSNSLRCPDAQDRLVVNRGFPGCQAAAYDDLFDVMGYSGTDYGEGNLNAVHLNGMNLLPGAVRKIPANSGLTTARITPLSTQTDERTLKITDPNGTSYFVEYRTNSGRDAAAGLTYFAPAWGVRVLRDDPAAPVSAGSYELDATPTSLSGYDYNRVIPVGGTFTSASRKLTIRVTAADADGASLTISNWAAPVVPSGVTLSIRSMAMVGVTITATTRVTDLHARAVAGWAVTLQKMRRGTTTWQWVRTVRTASNGVASYQFANGVSGSYRWVSVPATGAPSKVSPSVAVTSVARVIQHQPVTSMTHGRYLSVSGFVSPVPAPIVYIQYRYGAGPWHTGPRAKVSGTVVTGRIAMNLRATAYTRLYVRATTSYAGAVSGYHVTRVW
jgi:hypothetical protein